MATRSNILAEAGRRAGRTDTTFLTTLRGFLNEAVREWARKRPWIGLKRRLRMPTNGTRFLVLPSFVERPMELFDVTNASPIMPGANWDYEYPGAHADLQSGQALEWQDMGTVAAVTDPSGRVVVLSSSSADTSIEVTLIGRTRDTAASGTALEYLWTHEDLTLLGTSPVTSTNLFDELTTFSKSTNTAGTVTCRAASGALPLSRLGRFDNEARYRRLELMRIPAAGSVIELTVQVRPDSLDNDNQSPHPSIDEDFLTWYTAGLGLVSLGERQAGLTFLQKATAILDQVDFRDKAWGDMPNRIIPVWDSTRSEEDQFE